MTDTADFQTAQDELAPLRNDFAKSREMNTLRQRAAQEHRATRRLNDAITALLMLIAFPFGMALLALSICFGRSLPRALAAVVFMAAVNLTAMANTMFFDGQMSGILSTDSGLLSLLVKAAQAAGF